MFPNAESLSRADHPDTSHESAAKFTASGKRDNWKLKILTWFRDNQIFTDESALTSQEVGKASGMPAFALSKRMADMEADGYLVKAPKRMCRVTGETAYPRRALLAVELEFRGMGWLPMSDGKPKRLSGAEKVKAAVLAEREACARIAEGTRLPGWDIAAMIRARG